MQIATYLESWAVPWSDSSNNDISNLDTNLNTVYLAFAKPDNTYLKSQFSFSGTGLDFSLAFETVAASIKILQKRKVKVILAVGGGSYWSKPMPFNHLGCIDLMNDLGCDGIDIDWEVGITDNQAPSNAIQALFPFMQGKSITFTCFSTGAFPLTINDIYRGMNLKALGQCKSYISSVNVMVSIFTNNLFRPMMRVKILIPKKLFKLIEMFMMEYLIWGLKLGNRGGGMVF